MSILRRIIMCGAFFVFFGSVCFSQPVSEIVDKTLLKKVQAGSMQVLVAGTLPFKVLSGDREIFTGGYWLGQGSKKEDGKTFFTYEGGQFSVFKGRADAEVICEEPLKLQIDTKDAARAADVPFGFSEEMTVSGKTVRMLYDFEVNKDTAYPVNLYVSFDFNPEMTDKEVKPFIDGEKAVYETAKGPVIIAFSPPFLPDRFNVLLWKNFRVYVRFPGGLKKGERIAGEITVSLP
jgi:hypothetical protein